MRWKPYFFAIFFWISLGPSTLFAAVPEPLGLGRVVSWQDASGSKRWSMILDQCLAGALSPHAILTAAHCFDLAALSQILKTERAKGKLSDVKIWAFFFPLADRREFEDHWATDLDYFSRYPTSQEIQFLPKEISQTNGVLNLSADLALIRVDKKLDKSYVWNRQKVSEIGAKLPQIWEIFHHVEDRVLSESFFLGMPVTYQNEPMGIRATQELTPLVIIYHPDREVRRGDSGSVVNEGDSDHPAGVVVGVAERKWILPEPAFEAEHVGIVVRLAPYADFIDETIRTFEKKSGPATDTRFGTPNAKAASRR